MNDVNFVNKPPTPTPSNSAYVRVKIFRKPTVVKMLVDSGNLVNDLISEDFARRLKVKYTPVTKHVGTAAKGSSVKIIGRSEKIKLFIENIPRPVVIRPYIVKDLSHPINVGRDFLGRYCGKLEFTASDSYLEVLGSKVKLLTKIEPLVNPDITDARFKKVIGLPHALERQMILEGLVGSCEDTTQTLSISCKERTVIPGHSAKFVRVTTGGKITVQEAVKSDWYIEGSEVNKK